MRSTIFTQLKSGIRFLAVVLLLGMHFHVSAQKDRPAAGPKLSVPDERWKEGGVFSGYKPEDELLQFRTEISKTFKNSNGTNSACFVGAVHYKDENGFWQDISTNLVSGSSGFKNETQKLQSYFPLTSSGGATLKIADVPTGITWWSDPQIQFIKNGIILKTESAKNVNGNMSNNKITYAGVYDGFSDEFSVLNNRVKLNTIINNLSNNLPYQESDYLRVSQLIKVGNEFQIRDVNGEVLIDFSSVSEFSIVSKTNSDFNYFFRPIIVYDQNTNPSDLSVDKLCQKRNEGDKIPDVLNLNYRIEETDEGYRISYDVPVSWILSNDRQFPIVLDPEAVIGSNSSSTNQLWNGIYYDTRIQAIYLSSELTTAGVSNGSIISALSVYCTTANCTSSADGLSIGIQSTASSTFSNGNFTNSGYTSVFTGGSIIPASSTWFTHTFSSNYTFNSASNIVINFMMNQSNYDCASSTNFAVFTANNRRIYYNAFWGNSDPSGWTSGTRDDFPPYIKLIYTSATITASSSMTAFTSCPSTASTSQSFTVSGTNMAAGITVTAPAGFEVSANNSTWSGNGGNITIGAAGTIASTTVYARMAAVASAPANGNIVCSSTGATSVNVAVSGSFFAVPTATTTTASAVANFTATSGGNVTATGGSSVIARGVLWGISPGLTMPSASSTSDGAGTGSFTSSITGLSASTIYYYRAYAQNCSGYGYGPENTFVTTGPAAEGFYISGNIVNNGEIISTFDENYLRMTGVSKTITGSGKFTNSKLFADGTTTFDAGLVAESAFTETFVNTGKSLTIATGRTFKNGTMANYGTLTITGTGIINNTSNWFNGATGTVTFGGAGTIYAGANWTNDGTFTAGTASTVEFNGSTSGNTINGTTAFYKATINKGSSTATILDVVGTVTQTNSLTFTNGLLRIPTGGSWTKTDFGPTIGATSGLHVNGGTFTQNGASITNNGLFKTTTGTTTIGNSSGNSITNQSGSSFIIDGGGTVNIAGRMVATGSGSFNQSAGTVNICTSGNGESNIGSIDMASGTSFTLSGGAINMVQKSTGSPQIDYKNLAGTVAISGGTLTIGTSATSASSNFNIQGAMPPLVIDNTTNAKTATINGASTVYGNVTINATSSLVLNSGVTATVNGSLSNSGTYNATGTLNLAGNWVNNGTFTSNVGNTVVFNGSNASTIGGSGTDNFYNLTMSKTSATPQLEVTLGDGHISVANTLTLTTGNLNTGSYTTHVTNSASGAVSGGSTNSYVVGKLKRSVAGAYTYVFPVGQSLYEEAQLNFTTGYTSADITAFFTDGTPGALPVGGLTVNGTPLTSILDQGYWSIDPSSASGSPTYSVTLKETGHANGATSPSQYTVIKRTNTPSVDAWSIQGTHSNTTQADAGGIVTAVRSALSSFSDFAIAYGGGALPIELISFQANCSDNNTVDITWSTASEHNTNYFRVDKSRDGMQWDVLNTIGAAGNSNYTIDYALTDAFPNPGINYYRLTQYDLDGVFETFDAQAAVCKDQQSGTALSSYPNPSSGDFNVDLQTDELEGEATLLITDAKGAVVHSQDIKIIKGNNNFVIHPLTGSGKGFEPGIYYISVRTATSTVTTKHSMR